jgi:hypothetical protein
MSTTATTTKGGHAATGSHVATATVIPPPATKPAAPEAPALLAVGGLGDLLDPDAIQGTRFSGPLLSGAAEDGAAGIVILHKRAKITFSHGNFSVPIRFPPSTILDKYLVQLQQTYNGTTPKINIGTTLNGLDVANVDVSVAPTQLQNPIATILPGSWTLYLSQVLGGSTAGKATVLIYYSVPAKTVQS